ncbi:podoplanin isoform X4 [Rattus rattus]|nr:podoplanin isoform X4 [Rattus rattus]
MWTAPVLFWVLGSVWFWDSAQGGAIGALEDDLVTPGPGDDMVNPGLEDRIETTDTTGELDKSTAKAPLVPTQPPIEELPTSGTSDHKEHESTTTVKAVTSHSADKKTTHPNRDGLAVVTLVGIIIGVLLAIGFIGGIIIVVMRKISGRFS